MYKVVSKNKNRPDNNLFEQELISHNKQISLRRIDKVHKSLARLADEYEPREYIGLRRESGKSQSRRVYRRTKSRRKKSNIKYNNTFKEVVVERQSTLKGHMVVSSKLL